MENENEIVNENIIDKKNGVAKEKKATKNFETEIRIIEYYNHATGRKASIKAQSNIKPISARLREGISEQDLCDIVDFKVVEWTGTDMERHLVIDTLFGTKAEKYRTQVQNAKDKGLSVSQIKGNGQNGHDPRIDKDGLLEEALRAVKRRSNERSNS